MRLVHRIMCELTNGPPPKPEHDSAHVCGKGHLGCCHPKHVFWKTRSENLADRLRHGTMIRGEATPNAKLSASDVLAIRETKGVAQKDLAERYGIARSTLNQIVKHKKWRWL